MEEQEILRITQGLKPLHLGEDDYKVDPVKNTDIENKPVPGPPQRRVLQMYTLFFRHGVNPRCEKGFLHEGGFLAARQRAFEHCERMGYRFIFVRPLIVDLDEEERQQAGKPPK